MRVGQLLSPVLPSAWAGTDPAGHLRCSDLRQRPVTEARPVSGGIGPAEHGRARFQVDLTLYVDVVDPAALERAAVEHVDRTEFYGVDGKPSDRIQAREREAVRQDPAEALSVLLDPVAAVDPVAGAEMDYAEVSVTPVVDPAGAPPFGELFEPDPDPEAWWLTPRTAALLHRELSFLADQAYDDVETLGEQPVSEENAASLSVLGRLPRITWQQGSRWRQEFARAFDDLADDLEAGREPLPRCHGEEMALHLGLGEAASASRDVDGLDQVVADLPSHPGDYDWDLCAEVLFQDHDVLLLDQHWADGIEDPGSIENEALRIGDLRPPNWFHPFNNARPRDPSRGFR